MWCTIMYTCTVIQYQKEKIPPNTIVVIILSEIILIIIYAKDHYAHVKYII